MSSSSSSSHLLKNSGPTLRPSSLHVIHPPQSFFCYLWTETPQWTFSRTFLSPKLQPHAILQLSTRHFHCWVSLTLASILQAQEIIVLPRLLSQLVLSAFAVLSITRPALCVFDWPFLSPDSSTKLGLDFLQTVSHINFCIFVQIVALTPSSPCFTPFELDTPTFCPSLSNHLEHYGSCSPYLGILGASLWPTIFSPDQVPCLSQSLYSGFQESILFPFNLSREPFPWDRFFVYIHATVCGS